MTVVALARTWLLVTTIGLICARARGITLPAIMLMKIALIIMINNKLEVQRGATTNLPRGQEFVRPNPFAGATVPPLGP